MTADPRHPMNPYEEALAELGIPKDVYERAMGDVEERRRRFRRLLPPTADDLQLLLKGHLLIEEQLQRIMEFSVYAPAALGARWTFSQRARLARAMVFPLPPYEWVWAAIEHLNGARNTLVHQVEPGNLDELLRDFHAVCEAHRAAVEGSKLWRDLLPVWYNLDLAANLSRLDLVRAGRRARQAET